MGKFLIFGILMSLSAQTDPTATSLIPVDFVFDNRVTHTRDLPSEALRAARKRMVTGGKISNNELRALADAGDGLAAYRFAKLLQTSVPPAKAGSAAHYYAIAAYTGRAFAVPPLVQLLEAEGADYRPSLLEQSLNALTVQAISGNAKAAQSLAKMYDKGVPFGLNPKQAQHFAAIAGQDDPAAALKLGISLINDPADVALHNVGAIAALTFAAESTNLAAKVTAQNLLRQLNTPLNAKVMP